MELRAVIIEALGDKHTKELEDTLFFSILEFIYKVRESERKSTIKEVLVPIWVAINEINPKLAAEIVDIDGI